MKKEMQKYPNHLIFGAGMAAIGLFLIFNDRFFPWPPWGVGIFNDNFWGTLFIVDGLSMVVWVFNGEHSVRLNTFFLTVTVSFLGFLTIYEFFIWVATGQYESWISNGILTALALTLARGSDTRND